MRIGIMSAKGSRTLRWLPPRATHGRTFRLLLVAGFLLAGIGWRGWAADATARRLTWKECLNQPAAWYGSPEANRIAENVLLYQRQSGGWPKNTDMAAVLAEEATRRMERDRAKTDSTIDNGATTSQLIYLAKVAGATRQSRFEEAFQRGLEFLFEAQYTNGGWPQVYPRPKGYQAHITFNDGAMVGVLALLRDVHRGDGQYRFVDASRRHRAGRAVDRGVECILNCQVVVNGKPTVWGAQHDAKTFAPAQARIYEKISLSGGESVGIVRFLMTVEPSDARVVAAIEAAVAWFEASKLQGLRVVDRPDPSLPKGFDRVVVEDSQASPLWARFYEIGTNRPIFCGRDGVIKYSLAEIEHERRVGYAWYTDAPAKLLARDYPAWKKRLATP